VLSRLDITAPDLHPRRQCLKPPKPTRPVYKNRGMAICFENMMDRPCKFHERPGKAPNHTTRQCSFLLRLKTGHVPPPTAS
jgi:hypothetical protein